MTDNTYEGDTDSQGEAMPDTTTADDIGFLRHIPNILTVVRIFMVPALIILMLRYEQWAAWAALIVFIVASFTDYLDGHIARKHHIITDFGKIADPIADKALMLGAFITLSAHHGYPPWWFTIVVILREVAVTLLRMYLLRQSIVVPASKGGKFKTVTQMVLVILLLLWQVIGSNNLTYATVYRVIVDIVLLAAVVATVLSGLVYFLDAYDNSKARRHDGDASAPADDADAPMNEPNTATDNRDDVANDDATTTDVATSGDDANDAEGATDDDADAGDDEPKDDNHPDTHSHTDSTDTDADGDAAVDEDADTATPQSDTDEVDPEKLQQIRRKFRPRRAARRQSQQEVGPTLDHQIGRPPHEINPDDTK